MIPLTFPSRGRRGSQGPTTADLQPHLSSQKLQRREDGILVPDWPTLPTALGRDCDPKRLVTGLMLATWIGWTLDANNITPKNDPPTRELSIKGQPTVEIGEAAFQRFEGGRGVDFWAKVTEEAGVATASLLLPVASAGTRRSPEYSPGLRVEYNNTPQTGPDAQKFLWRVVNAIHTLTQSSSPYTTFEDVHAQIACGNCGPDRIL